MSHQAATPFAPPVLPARRTWLAGMASGALLCLAGCASGVDGPRTLRVSEAQLAQRIAGQFPLQRRYLELFDLTLSSPRLRLVPAENRLATRVDVALADFWGGSRRLEGTLTLSYGLRYEPQDRSVRMTDVRLDAFDMPRLSGPLASQVQRLGALVAAHLLNDFSVHSFGPDALLALQGRGWRPGALTVVEGGLQLELLPVRD